MFLMRTAVHQRVNGGHVLMPGEVAAHHGGRLLEAFPACRRHVRAVSIVRDENTSTSVRRGRKEPACVAPGMERIDASLDDSAEGPLMMPPWSLPLSRADGMARLTTLTTADVQVSIAGRARDHRQVHHPPVRALGVRGRGDRRHGQSGQHRSGGIPLWARVPRG
jgi:hypothetical protein